MTLHHDLIEQALHLAIRESKKPRQASLRRAVSTAYYSLFHMLRDDAVRRLFPSQPPDLRSKAARAMAHGDAKNVCKLFMSGSGITGLTRLPMNQDLRDVASAFHDLQEARHKADYDLLDTYDRIQVLGYVQRAKDAMSKWTAVRTTADANVFLVALFLHPKWNKV